MTDSPELAPKSAKKPRGKAFKSGFDARRWLSGRGPKSPEQREGDEILRSVIWEELSREFDTANMKPLDNPDTIDAMRLMVRSWIKKHPEAIADRIAGKVTERHDLTNSDGSLKPEKESDDTRTEILRKLDSITTAIGASGVSKQSDK